jgi:hypothetical protein
MATETVGEQPTAQAPLDRAPPRWALLVLLCLALLIRGRVMLATRYSLETDPDSYQSVAWRIYSTQSIAMWGPGAGATTLTALRSPLYPLSLAAFRTLQLPMSAEACGLLHVFFGVATVWGVWRLGQLWGLSVAGALLAAGLIAIDPILLNQASQLTSDTLAALMAVLAMLALTRCGRTGSIRTALVAGAMCGLCILSRATFLSWFVVVLAWMALAVAGSRRIARVGAMAVAAAAVRAPWAIRNQSLFGWPVVTNTDGGYSLLVANNPQFYEYLRKAPWGATWEAEPFCREWYAFRLIEDTPNGPITHEVSNDMEAYEKAWENIRLEPDMFAYAALMRVGWLWGVLPHQTNSAESASRRGMRCAVAGWYVLELAAAVAGAWFLRKKLLAEPWVWGTLLLVCFTLVHALYWTDLHMRAPLMSVVALFAAEGIVTLARRRRAPSAVPA